MITTEYIPVNKKQYAEYIIKIEAENKALKAKILAYEKVMNSKIKRMNYRNKAICIKNEQPQKQQKEEIVSLKKSANYFMQFPENNEHLIHPIVKHLLNKKKTNITTEDNIRDFLNNY
jgi:hypothetical protein